MGRVREGGYLFFQLHKKDATTAARLGTVHTIHGDVPTPFFMPVATTATIKTMSSVDLNDIGSPVVLSNTYHLYLRPGLDVIGAAWGLHKFMNWKKPISICVNLSQRIHSESPKARFVFASAQTLKNGDCGLIFPMWILNDYLMRKLFFHNFRKNLSLKSDKRKNG